MSERPQVWTGWRWHRNRWQRLCQAETPAACSALVEQTRGATPGHRCVCKAGSSPPTYTPRARSASWATEQQFRMAAASGVQSRDRSKAARFFDRLNAEASEREKLDTFLADEDADPELLMALDGDPDEKKPLYPIHEREERLHGTRRTAGDRVPRLPHLTELDDEYREKKAALDALLEDETSCRAWPGWRSTTRPWRGSTGSVPSRRSTTAAGSRRRGRATTTPSRVQDPGGGH